MQKLTQGCPEWFILYGQVLQKSACGLTGGRVVVWSDASFMSSYAQPPIESRLQLSATEFHQ